MFAELSTQIHIHLYGLIFDFEQAVRFGFSTVPPGPPHNLIHKYLDPKINLSEFRQILCETTPRRATYLATLRERDLSLGVLRLSSFNAPKHRPIGRCLLSLGSVVPEFLPTLGGGARETFLYQKIILFASKKPHSCRNT